MTGRKTKLNKETIQLIGNMAEKGCDNKTICDILGIYQSTFYNWIKKAKEEKPQKIYVDFYKSLSRSQRLQKQKAITTIMKSIEKGDWHAAKYLLGVRDPDYLEGKKVSLGGQEDNPLQVQEITFEIGDKSIEDNTD